MSPSTTEQQDEPTESVPRLGLEHSNFVQRSPRPKLYTRKSSGTIIVPRDTQDLERDEDYDENDARTMSPRRSCEEVDQLEDNLRQNMIE